MKATPPKLSGPKRPFNLLCCLDWIRKARQCWRTFWNGLGKPPRAKHIKHNSMLGRDLAPQRHYLLGGGYGGPTKAMVQGNKETGEGQAEQVKPGKLTRRTLTTVIKWNSRRPPWYSTRLRQTETAKLFQMRGNLSTSQGTDVIPGSSFLCEPHVSSFGETPKSRWAPTSINKIQTHDGELIFPSQINLSNLSLSLVWPDHHTAKVYGIKS